MKPIKLFLALAVEQLLKNYAGKCAKNSGIAKKIWIPLVYVQNLVSSQQKE